MAKRRVVITGLGLVTPLGVGVSHSWDALVSGASGIGTISSFDASGYPVSIAGEVPLGKAAGSLDINDYIPSKEQKKMDTFIAYGIVAAQEAMKDSGFIPVSDEEKERCGVYIGSGIGGLPNIYKTSIALHERNSTRVSPFFIPSCLINLISGHVSIKHEFRGPNSASVTACSSGAHSIGDATSIIMQDKADVMLAGASEAAVCPPGLLGFSSMHALASSFNDRPTEASRPWDKCREGFVMGEGAGILVLEELEHAKKRGAHIYAEVSGYGLSGDGHHITAPNIDGPMRSMRMALKESGVSLDDIGYINAHGTSTPLGDINELAAVQQVFSGSSITMSSTKSSIGHLLGASGSVEAVFSIKAMQTGILPPTLNLDDPVDEGKNVDFVPKVAKEKTLKAVLSNSFGFGGTNASLVFTKYA